MTIVYSLVSRGKTVLAEYTQTSGNFPTVTRVLLSKIPNVDGRMTYVYDAYVFHYVVESGICYLCMSDEPSKHRIPYAFLQDMKLNFTTKYGTEQPLKAIAFSFNDEFSKVLKDRMEYYNSPNPNIDNIGLVKSQIEEVKDVMVENIEKVLERGEKIELLVDKTDRLSKQAYKFESTSKNLRRTMWWKNFRQVMFLTIVVAAVVYIMASFACGGLDFHKCKSN